MHARYFSWGVFACVARLDYVILISPSFTSKSRMCCIATHPGFCKTVTSNICRLYSSHMTCFVSLPTREWEGDDIGQNLARLSLRAHQHRRPASRRDPSRIGNRTDGQDVSSWVHTCTWQRHAVFLAGLRRTQAHKVEYETHQGTPAPLREFY